MYKGLPEFCYSVLDTDAEVIILKKGETGYYPSKCHLTETEYSTRLKQAKEVADELNVRLEITKAQAEAMKVGSMFGWDGKGADPSYYDENGLSKGFKEIEFGTKNVCVICDKLIDEPLTVTLDENHSAHMNCWFDSIPNVGTKNRQEIIEKIRTELIYNFDLRYIDGVKGMDAFLDKFKKKTK